MDPRTVLLPDVRDFADVLTYVAEWDHDHKPDVSPRDVMASGPGRALVTGILSIGRDLGMPFASDDPAARNKIGPFCTIDGHETQRRSIAVTATELAIDAIAPRLVTDDDRLSFAVHVHADGRALVVAQHSQIIGSHWLAFVDPATLPAYPFARRDERVRSICDAIRDAGDTPYRHRAPEPYAVHLTHRENGTSAIIYPDGAVRRTWPDGTVSYEPA
jgi:hypothetical protein